MTRPRNDAVNKSEKRANPQDRQAKMVRIQQDYRQLRYGRLSTLEISHSEYQKALKQLKKNVRELR
ncbi:hypothetical protein ACQKEI_11370 [Psychrobacter namhaensis]|uniref:hypothetical protein n=1 Tax=Psychrobacter namhaensis TaxID=292734 RepID=UPI003D009508